MATVNLGRIKPVFRGAYSGSTAYVIDDIVTHADETYICIQAHGAGTQATSQTAYWTKLAAKGTDGTNVATTITTQGDILYRDGSGLQRLAKGTAGQVLKMNSGANAPEWGTDAGGSVLAVSQKIYGGTNSINTVNRESDYGNIASNSYEISQLTLAMTPSANTSKFLIQMNLQAGHEDNYVGMGWITYQASGGTEYAITSSGSRGVTFRFDDDNHESSNAANPSISHCIMVAPNTTNAVTFRVRIATANSSWPWYINRNPSNSTDVDDGGYMLSTLTVFELDGSKSTKAVTTVNETKT